MAPCNEKLEFPVEIKSPERYAGAVYEQDLVRNVTGPAIRPGGLSLTDRAMEFCDFPENSRILDAGCGCGTTVKHLRNRWSLRAMGIDISQKLLSEGGASETLPLIRGEAAVMPWKSGSMDGITCECVLSILPEPEKTLGEYHRVLKSGGYLIVSDIFLRADSSAYACSRSDSARMLSADSQSGSPSQSITGQPSQSIAGGTSKTLSGLTSRTVCSPPSVSSSGSPSRETEAVRRQVPYNSCFAGAVDRDTRRQQIESAGFTILLWEDHTKLLKELAARFVFEHGSLSKFRELILPTGCAGGSPGNINSGKPGYSLTIGVKKL